MSGKNREGGKIEGELDEWLSTEMRCLNTGPNWIWSKMTLKGICHMRVVKVNLGMRSFEGHSRYFARQLPRSPGCAPWEDEWPAEHTSSLPDFVCRVCLCFPSTEPGVFPLIILSPRPLDHPGVQSRTEVSGSVRQMPGLALRSVRFWKWFQGWDVLPSETWPPSQVVLLSSSSFYAPHCPSLHTCLPYPFLSASPLCTPFPVSHALLFSPDCLALSFHHCALWLSVPWRQESANFLLAKSWIENIVDFVYCIVSIITTHYGDRQR